MLQTVNIGVLASSRPKGSAYIARYDATLGSGVGYHLDGSSLVDNFYNQLGVGTRDLTQATPGNRPSVTTPGGVTSIRTATVSSAARYVSTTSATILAMVGVSANWDLYWKWYQEYSGSLSQNYLGWGAGSRSQDYLILAKQNFGSQMFLRRRTSTSSEKFWSGGSITASAVNELTIQYRAGVVTITLNGGAIVTSQNIVGDGAIAPTEFFVGGGADHITSGNREFATQQLDLIAA